MAAESRRVVAETAVHAQALAQNLSKQNFVIESQTATEWVLRRKRRRGDITVTISIRQSGQPGAPFRPPAPQSRLWPPPSGQAAT